MQEIGSEGSEAERATVPPDPTLPPTLIRTRVSTCPVAKLALNLAARVTP